MMDAMIVPLLVTTDLPPDSDVAEFGALVAGAVRTLQRGDVTYPGHLRGKTFWLDQPAPPADDDGPPPSAEELRFAAVLGFLSVAVPHEAAHGGTPGAAGGGRGDQVRHVVADARAAISAAVSARYGDLGSPPAVMGIRADDVRERTPRSAIAAETAEPVPELAAAARSYL